jgi:hypothetical protein
MPATHVRPLQKCWIRSKPATSSEWLLVSVASLWPVQSGNLLAASSKQQCTLLEPHLAGQVAAGTCFQHLDILLDDTLECMK